MSGGSEKATHRCLLGFCSLLKLGSDFKRDPYLTFAVNCSGSLFPSSKLEKESQIFCHQKIACRRCEYRTGLISTAQMFLLPVGAAALRDSQRGVLGVCSLLYNPLCLRRRNLLPITKRKIAGRRGIHHLSITSL